MSSLPKLLLVAAGLLLQQGMRSQDGPRRSRRESGSLKNIMADWKRKQDRRKPPEAGMPVPAVPPQGPLPKTGGAEAPLEFD